LPKRNRASIESTSRPDDERLGSPAGYLPTGEDAPEVGPGVVTGLVSSEGGPESAEGPRENLGVGRGCTGMSVTEPGRERAVLFPGEVERCGVTALFGAAALRAWAIEEATVDGCLASFPVTAGVSGGVCIVELGGECRGEAAAEPAGSRRDGVVMPEGT